MYCLRGSFSVLFVCKCVLHYCHRVATQLQLNISYHISYLLLTIGCFWTMKIIYFLKINLTQALVTHKNNVNSKELKWWKVFIATEELKFLVSRARMPVCRLLSFPILVCYLNHFSQQSSRNKRKPKSRIKFDRPFHYRIIYCVLYF